MDRNEAKQILRSVVIAYPNYRVESLSDTLDEYSKRLEKADFYQVEKNLDNHIKSSKFAPSFAELLSKPNGRVVPNAEETRAYLQKLDEYEPADEAVIKEEAAKVRAMLGVRTGVSN